MINIFFGIYNSLEEVGKPGLFNFLENLEKRLLMKFIELYL